MAKLERVTNITLHARPATGTTGAKAARRDGNVPGVVYGHGGSQAITIDMKSLSDLITTGGQSHIVDATIDGKHESVLLRDVQRDPLTFRPITVDFQRVSQTEAINATVAIHVVGVAAGVKDEGGVMDTVTHAIDVKGPAGKLPEHFEVDVTKLAVGEHITAGDIKLPAGFTLITAAETTVVSIEGARAEDPTLEAPVAEEPAAAPAPAAE